MLKCHIVQDLLPNYIEGLTGEETNCEIAEHLQGCPECTKLFQEMKTPIAKQETEYVDREIDYLKKIRTGNMKKILAVVGGLLVLAAVVTYLFIIGSPVASKDMTYETEMVQNGEEWVVHLELVNGKELRMNTDYVFDTDAKTGDMVLRKVLLKPYQVWPSPIYEGNKFLYGLNRNAKENVQNGSTVSAEPEAGSEDAPKLQAQVGTSVQVVIQFADREVVLLQ